MGSKHAKAVLYGLTAAVILTIGVAYALTRLPYLPREPLEISRNFMQRRWAVIRHAWRVLSRCAPASMRAMALSVPALSECRLI
jgi:hypothetical protein